MQQRLTGIGHAGGRSVSVHRYCAFAIFDLADASFSAEG